ncbi:MAG TPA: phosphate ABC transporter substrate-binding protein PstS [Rhizomicrobium sp.]|jgi:phosphate transport system substrate-binding protein
MKPFAHRLIAAACGAAVGLMITAASAATMSGAGATFPELIYNKWAEAYKAKTGIGLNYQGIGSGGGISQIKAKTVDFGASDKPMSPGDLDASGLTQFPTVIGGVVPVANVPGIKPGELVLDGPTLAAICLGTVKFWDDAAIKKLNPSAALPHLAVLGVHRSDGSGTNFIFTDYLSKVSPAWAQTVGASTLVDWPSGVGAKGNEGVANAVKEHVGALGYVEFAYAKQNTLTYIRMINKDGVPTEPTAEAFQAASARTDWAHAPGFYVVLTNQSGHAAWPIAGATFIIVYKNPADPAKTKEVLKFFDWAYANGGDLAKQLYYVPLPASTVDAIKKSWHANINAAAVP